MWSLKKEYGIFENFKLPLLLKVLMRKIYGEMCLQTEKLEKQHLLLCLFPRVGFCWPTLDQGIRVSWSSAVWNRSVCHCVEHLLPKLLCGRPALFSEGKAASANSLYQKHHSGPTKPPGCCAQPQVLLLFFFSVGTRTFKILFLSKRPASPVSKNQSFLLASEKRGIPEQRARVWSPLPGQNMPSVILMAQY